MTACEEEATTNNDDDERQIGKEPLGFFERNLNKQRITF